MFSLCRDIHVIESINYLLLGRRMHITQFGFAHFAGANNLIKRKCPCQKAKQSDKIVLDIHTRFIDFFSKNVFQKEFCLLTSGFVRAKKKEPRLKLVLWLLLFLFL